MHLTIRTMLLGHIAYGVCPLWTLPSHADIQLEQVGCIKTELTRRLEFHQLCNLIFVDRCNHENISSSPDHC